MALLIDLNGLTFNCLKIIERSPNHHNRTGANWLCQCICGKKVIARSDDLRMGKVKSCGCRKLSRHRLNKNFEKKYALIKDGCKEWQGRRDKDGQPIFGGGKSVISHIYEFHYGLIPKNTSICKSCKNKGCVNIQHMFLEKK